MDNKKIGIDHRIKTQSPVSKFDWKAPPSVPDITPQQTRPKLHRESLIYVPDVQQAGPRLNRHTVTSHKTFRGPKKLP